MFQLGRLLSTPAALEAMEAAGERPETFLSRHQKHDWGDVCRDDRKANDDALEHGGRLLSSYRTKLGVKLWVITEADRAATTILLPSDY